MCPHLNWKQHRPENQPWRLGASGWWLVFDVSIGREWLGPAASKGSIIGHLPSSGPCGYRSYKQAPLCGYSKGHQAQLAENSWISPLLTPLPDTFARCSQGQWSWAWLWAPPRKEAACLPGIECIVGAHFVDLKWHILWDLTHSKHIFMTRYRYLPKKASLSASGETKMTSSYKTLRSQGVVID